MLHQISYPTNNPDEPFTILEPQNPWINEFQAVQERRAMDFNALKLQKGPSGWHRTDLPTI